MSVREARVVGKIRCFDRIEQTTTGYRLVQSHHLCFLESGSRVLLLGSPEKVLDLEGESNLMINVRHETHEGRLHEGWIAVGSLDLTTTQLPVASLLIPLALISGLFQI